MSRLEQWILALMLIAMIAVFGGLMYVLVGVQQDGIRIHVEGEVMLGTSQSEGPALVELVMADPVRLTGAEEDGSLTAVIGILDCPECGSNNTKKVLSVIGLARVKGDHSASQGSCCGYSNPCSDPKRCCES